MKYDKTRGNMYFLLMIIFILTIGAVIFIIQNKTNSIISDLTMERTEAANRELVNYLLVLEVRASLRSEIIANKETIVRYILNNDYSSIDKELNDFLLGIDHIMICDPKGIVVYRSNASNIGEDISSHVNVSAVQQTGMKSSSISFTRTTRSLGIISSAPVYNDGNLIAILSCILDLRKNEYLDTFKERTGCEATIFMGDKRINTTLIDQAGHRAIDTAADPAVVQAVLGNEGLYTGYLELFGQHYGVCYSPLVSDNNVIGMLFTGIETGSIVKSRKSVNYWVTLASLLGLVAMICCIIISNNILRKYTQLVQDLSEKTSANRAKSEFLSTMSHELRTPLNAIIGMTAIGRRTTDTERKNYSLDKIDEASAHLMSVINDVLDMSKIEANKLELSIIDFNFRQMLHKVMTIISFRAEDKHQRLLVNTDDTIPDYLTGDDQRLAQVILNLLSNAVKFTPEGGTICLDAHLTNENAGECELRIEVSDNGIGVSLEHQQRLFTAFGQAENGISREFGGTGLGLAISKRIIELMGGKIWIESESGKGARFIFTIKAHVGSASGLASGNAGGNAKYGEEHSVSHSPGEFAGKRLLFAEDVAINREILLSLLEDSGLIIDCAEDGKEALHMIEAKPGLYDIVFMDVQMPQMDGLEATRRIRALSAPMIEKLPIIAMTANVFTEDINHCIEAGMNDHLGKPINLDDVYEKLRKYLGG